MSHPHLGMGSALEYSIRSLSQCACISVCRMQPLLHRFSKRIERALRAEAAAEAAEAAELEEAAFMAASSDDSSGDEQPLFRREVNSGKAKKEASLPPKAKSKLKLKLKVGGVSLPSTDFRKSATQHSLVVHLMWHARSEQKHVLSPMLACKPHVHDASLQIAI